MKSYLITFILCIVHVSTQAQCETSTTIILNNTRGGFYANQKVSFTNNSNGSVIEKVSDANGEVTANLPCGHGFKVKIANYSRVVDIKTSERGGSSKRAISYSPDNITKSRAFAMNEEQRKLVDQIISGLPDTTRIRASRMSTPRDIQNYSQFRFKFNGLEGEELSGEYICFTGEKRHKSFVGNANSNGEILVYLPKGDNYILNFKHHKNFKNENIAYTKGTAHGTLEITYMGTKEAERRIAEEKERVRIEEERLKREKEEFEAYCKREKISLEEGMKRKLASSNGGADTVVSAVLNRYNWSEKLIVCDLTGSMNPYASQLAAWYQLNLKKEENLQFVFFNDGDSKDDAMKIIGSTGGIYYQKANGLVPLIGIMAEVRAKGNGGDCAENNMEALIKGVEMANPYKELVMIADNNAPVKDIEMLKNFKRPVHIIICGHRGWVHEDYLNIALHTKGSVHTMEEDIERIAKMSEGEEIIIGDSTYKIMGGKFVLVTKT